MVEANPPPNQALKLTVASWVHYAWRATVSTKLKVISVNSFRLVQIETYQRRSLAPVR
jgi:hypothetical protein